ncbi:helix-turn-helix transcriptional regulator [Streptomyces spinosus]|uniref:helix-turn-helix transcriptional regulator n=1 Tax=Streptomyces spinosus TaxID=2872623 RepID=UPI001CECFE9D|nr:LuxR C-terminal-related transcriptional regulator [Streptomyces spinosus]
MTEELRGREPALELLTGALASAARGQGGAVLLEGPQGSGRSRMLAEVVHRALNQGFTVCRAIGDHVRHPAFLAPLGLSSAPADPDGPESDPVRQLTDHLAAGRVAGPVLLALDDVQWAEPATLSALRGLSGLLSTKALPVLMVVTCPAERGSDAVDRLIAALTDDGAVHCELGPLSAQAAAALLADVLGAAPDEALTDLCSAAGGLPTRLIELAGTLRDTGAVHIAGGRATPAEGPLPDRLRRLALRPVLGLSGLARSLLDVTAALGPSASLADLALALDRGAMVLMPAVQECVDAGALVATDRCLTFRHTLLWRAVRDAVPLPVRSALQRELGELLASRGDFRAAVGHLAAALRAGEAGVAPSLELAGRELLRQAPVEAVRLLEQAVDSLPRQSEKAALLSVVTSGLTAQGRLRQAADTARTALARACPPGAAAELSTSLAEIELMTGSPQAAAERVEPLLASVATPDPTRLRALAVRTRAHCSPSDPADVHRAADALGAAAADAGAGAGTHADAAARLLRATARWHEGRAADTLAELRLPPEHTEHSHPDGYYWDPRPGLAGALVDLGAFTEARAVLAALGNEFEDLDLPAWRPSVLAPTAVLALETGDLDAATEHAAAVLEGPADGLLLPARLLALSVQAEAALRKGLPHEAEAPAAQLLSLLRTDRFDLAAGRALRAVLRTTEVRGGPAEVLAVLAHLAADGTGRQDAGALDVLPALLLAGPATPAWLIRVARTAGDERLAARVAELARRAGDASPGLAATGAAAAHADGLLRGSPALLSQGAAGHPDPWSRAQADEDLADLVLTTGEGGGEARREQAVRRLQQALDGYEAARSALDAARVRGMLRRLGVRRRHWTYASRPTTGWPSLTDTERAVADLVAQGLTNRETAQHMFLSPYTVNFHLRQIFRKLGITSRVELARMYRDPERSEPAREPVFPPDAAAARSRASGHQRPRPVRRSHTDLNAKAAHAASATPGTQGGRR